MFNSCFVFSFILSIILFIVFIPGMVFTIPESYKNNTDILSKIIVGAVHGSIFLIIFSVINCK